MRTALKPAGSLSESRPVQVGFELILSPSASQPANHPWVRRNASARSVIMAGPVHSTNTDNNTHQSLPIPGQARGSRSSHRSWGNFTARAEMTNAGGADALRDRSLPAELADACARSGQRYPSGAVECDAVSWVLRQRTVILWAVIGCARAPTADRRRFAGLRPRRAGLRTGPVDQLAAALALSASHWRRRHCRDDSGLGSRPLRG
ncbi:hypothetical protein Thiosp_02058 [Thiorhodovibrio litoralis]|nr:hypothetical protein Thiosp_02058 [Thiorhodovibrio litoralis]